MNKKIMLLGLGLVCSLAAVGTSLAYVYGDAVKQESNYTLEAGTVLKFTDNSNENISSVKFGEYVTKEVSIKKPVSSASVKDAYTVKFVLDDKNVASTSKVKVEISETAWTAEGGELNVQTLVNDVETSVNYTDNVSIAADFNGVDVKTYYLRFTLDKELAAKDAVLPSAELTITYDHDGALNA